MADKKNSWLLFIMSQPGKSTTPRIRLWRLLKSLRNQGRADGGGWLEHARLGFNYRIDDIRAALGIGQLEKIETILALRRSVAQRYSELLGGIQGVDVPLPDDTFSLSRLETAR